MSAKSDCFALIQEIAVTRDVFCRAPNCRNRSSCGHHIFSRAQLSTAFDPRYILGVCVFCHVPWCHGRPKEFREWILRQLGEDAFYEGLALSKTTCKYQDYNKIRDELRAVLAAYKRKESV